MGRRPESITSSIGGLCSLDSTWEMVYLLKKVNLIELLKEVSNLTTFKSMAFNVLDLALIHKKSWNFLTQPTRTKGAISVPMATVSSYSS